MRAYRFEGRLLEESHTDVILLQHRHARSVEELATLYSKSEHPLENGQLTIDFGRSCTCVKSFPREGSDIHRRDCGHATATKVGFQVQSNPALQMAE